MNVRDVEAASSNLATPTSFNRPLTQVSGRFRYTRHARRGQKATWIGCRSRHGVKMKAKPIYRACPRGPAAAKSHCGLAHKRIEGLLVRQRGQRAVARRDDRSGWKLGEQPMQVGVQPSMAVIAAADRTREQKIA